MNKKNLIVVAGLGVLTLGSLSFAAVNGIARNGDFSVVKTAVETNNYASLSDAAKAKITEAQFAEMVQKSSQHKAEKNAITAGDYTAFKAAKIAQIPNETEFQKMVSAQKARTETQTKIETAVKNNDFVAFKAAVLAQKAQMEANRPDKNGKTRTAPTDTQLQAQFNKLAEYYTANGKLPDVGGPGFGGGKGLEMPFRHFSGPRGEGHGEKQ